MKRRSDSFFGIHSDFHARPWMGKIGRTLREEDIRKVCRALKPDFWQIDCKGHFGWASYPSELGNAMPTEGDPLEVWRKVTREEDVALYMHYSGLWEEKYCSEHPEDRIMKADGTFVETTVYPHSKYADELLIPQISELVEKYDIDGVWIDGDNWACWCDYHDETLAAFEKETGIDLGGAKPAAPTDPYYHEYVQYNRELFRRYVKHYVDILHAKYPHLQITSNWLFSDMMPEKPCIDVDFISGDTAPFNTLNNTRYTARYLPGQNKTWDLMGMAQRYNGAEKVDVLPISPAQLMQQAAATISLGGAFQFDIQQYTDGSPKTIALMSYEPVAKFIRERKPYCFKAKPVPQAAMLVSTFDRYQESAVFSRGRDDSKGKRGLCSLLCNAGQSFETVSEHTLKDNIDRYSMIVIPEILNGLAEETVKELLDYSERGGNLLLVGPNTCRIFADAGAPFVAKELDDEVPTELFLAQRVPAKDQRYLTIDDSVVGGVLYPIQLIGKGDCEVVAHTFYTEHSERKPFAIIAKHGNGKISAIGADIGRAYEQTQQYLYRVLVQKIADKLYTPLVRIEKALGFLDIVCLEKDGRILVQLLNGNGNHHNILCDTEDFIPPVIDIELSISQDIAEHRLVLQPEGKELDFYEKDGRIYIKLDRLDMHNVIEISS